MLSSCHYIEYNSSSKVLTRALHPIALHARLIEDYVVLSMGMAFYKILRLLLLALMCVHVFACLFYRVKKESAISQDDVEGFYHSRNSNSTVLETTNSLGFAYLETTDMIFWWYFWCMYDPVKCVSEQDLPSAYVSSYFSLNICFIPVLDVSF